MPQTFLLDELPQPLAHRLRPWRKSEQSELRTMIEVIEDQLACAYPEDNPVEIVKSVLTEFHEGAFAVLSLLQEEQL